MIIETEKNPNHNVSFIDAGMPGMLPTLNEECVRQAIKTGLGLNAKINKYSEFSRKNYFYADLPQGYQITQFQYPLVGEGSLEVETEDGSRRTIGIERIHIEQDAGKSIHDLDPSMTFVDLNRAGVGLMEIVTKADFRSPEEAGEFLRKLRSIVRYLGTCDGNMDEGSMRCDVNVSVRKVGETSFRPRSEMKNVNSVRFVMQKKNLLMIIAIFRSLICCLWCSLMNISTTSKKKWSNSPMRKKLALSTNLALQLMTLWCCVKTAR